MPAGQRHLQNYYAHGKETDLNQSSGPLHMVADAINGMFA
jgi:hypothetical protein